MTLLSPRVVGDVTLVFVLLSIAFYGFLVVGHFLEYWQLDAFGKNWALDGFCLSFKESFFHTHLLCFYGDAILGAFVYMLCPRNRPEINVIRSSIPSVVAHGGAHGLLWALPLGWQASTKKMFGSGPLKIQSVYKLHYFWVFLFFGISFYVKLKLLFLSVLISFNLSYTLFFYSTLFLHFWPLHMLTLLSFLIFLDIVFSLVLKVKKMFFMPYMHLLPVSLL
mmetsp:Transcript_22173/g.27547  ORF Transcript_22173/g.27547 Transcript_22173/m.27547 type:complete len:222 (+) Transcript_22173:45-710(+)